MLLLSGAFTHAYALYTIPLCIARQQPIYYFIIIYYVQDDRTPVCFLAVKGLHRCRYMYVCVYYDDNNNSVQIRVDTSYRAELCKYIYLLVCVYIIILFGKRVRNIRFHMHTPFVVFTIAHTTYNVQ